MGLGVDRATIDVELEMQVTGGRGRVAGPADAANDLADVDLITALERRRMDHMRVPVLAPLRQSPDHHVVAFKTRVVCALDDRPCRDGRQRRAAAGGDVESLVEPPAVAEGSELADRTARPVRAAHREEVAVELDAA